MKVAFTIIGFVILLFGAFCFLSGETTGGIVYGSLGIVMLLSQQQQTKGNRT